MKLYVIRHGETEANKEGRFQGWLDNPLNEKGIELAEITGKEMKGIKIDGCYSSPLIRARQTAEIILRESGNENAPIICDDRIKEINMGAWEGKRFRTEPREVPFEVAKEFFNRPFEFPGFPEGETARQVCERTQSFLKELTAAEEDRKDPAAGEKEKNDPAADEQEQNDLAADGAEKTYLISIHGFAMRAMLNYLYEDPSDFWQQHVPLNCEVNILEADAGQVRFVEKDKTYYDTSYCVDRYKEMRE